jgi:cytochrome b6-f complex iron-sulfur subunit
MTHQVAPYGPVHGPPTGEITRRSFMRRMLGVGVGILSLEFLGGTLAFLWPQLSEGLGANINIGSAADINSQFPQWAEGLPYIYSSANLFIVNVPAAKARVEGNGTVASPIPDPGTEVSLELPAADRSVMALWRKCPHLGCMVPGLCEERKRFECRCHGSTYNILGEKLERGPAARGMDRFAVDIDEDGALVIDTREIIRGAPEGTVTFTDPHPADVGCA